MFINFESFLLSYFSILGILVTLLSISSSLSKEVKFDLIKKYLIFDVKNSFFIFFLIFILALGVVFQNSEIESMYLILLLINLIITSIISINFFINLNEKSILDKIITTKINNIEKLNEILNDLKDNFFYTSFNSSKLNKEKLNVIKKLLRKTFSNEKYRGEVKEQIFYDGEFKEILFDNKNLNEWVDFIYKLRAENGFNDIDYVFFIEDFLFEILKLNFINSKSFSPNLNTSSLYLKEGIDLKLINKFKTEKENKNLIKNFNSLLSLKINQIKNLCLIVLDLNINSKDKLRYIETQLESLYSIMSGFKYFNSDFDSFEGNYNSFLNLESKKDKTKNDEKILENIRLKQDIINFSKKNLELSKLEIMYKILFLIDKKDLSSEFFIIALKIKDSIIESSPEYYFKSVDFDFENKFLFYKIDFRNFASSSFQNLINFIKFKLIFELNNYLAGESFDFQSYQKEEFMNPNGEKYLIEIEKLNFFDIQKFFKNISEKELKSFKKKSKEEVSKLIKKYSQEELNYIIQTPIKNSSKTKESQYKIFKEIELFNNFLNSFFEINKKPNQTQKSDLWGINILESKDWFLEDTFNKNIGLATSMVSENLTRDYTLNKIKRINKSIADKYDSEFVVEDLYNDLKINLIETKKEYILFINKDFNLYDFPNFERNRKYPYYSGEIDINNSKIYIFEMYHFNSSLLVEKGEIFMNSYKNIIEENKGLYVKIKTLEESEIQEIVNSSSNNIKTREEAQKLVNIKVLEKFDITRKNNSKIIKLIK